MKQISILDVLHMIGGMFQYFNLKFSFRRECLVFLIIIIIEIMNLFNCLNLWFYLIPELNILLQVSACYTQRLRWGSATELVVGDTPAELEMRVMERVGELRHSGFNPQRLPAVMMHRVSSAPASNIMY